MCQNKYRSVIVASVGIVMKMMFLHNLGLVYVFLAIRLIEYFNFF